MSRPFIFIFLFIFGSCKEEPVEIFDPPESKDLRKIKFEQIGYDSLRVDSGDEFILKTQSIDYIYVGINDSSQFIPIDTIDYFNTQIDDSSFQYIFNDTVKFPKKYLFLPLQIKLKAKETIIQIDTLMSVFNYPYRESHIFMTSIEYDVLGNADNVNVLDDFDLCPPFFSYRYRGSYGMVFMNLENKDVNIPFVSSGESLFCIGDSAYFDSGRSYGIYDMRKKDYLSHGGPGHSSSINLNEKIYGMALYKDTVYVGTNKRDDIALSSERRYRIHRFTMSGSIIDTIHTPIFPWRMTIDDYKIYNVSSIESPVISWHMNTDEVKHYLSPSKFAYSVKIRGDRLYYYDHMRGFIAYIDKNALIEIEQ